MSNPRPLLAVYNRPPATLADLERFCRSARLRGGSDGDTVSLVRGPFRIPLRRLRLALSLARNREQAYREDTTSPDPGPGRHRARGIR